MSDAIADHVNDFDRLEARQQTLNKWTVLSYRNDSLTAYEVDVKDLSCDCEDMQVNKQGNEV